MAITRRFIQLVQREDMLDDTHLAHLRDYKYSSIDLSPTTKYVLRHWWNVVASYMPAWLAPNMITLIGLGFVLFNVATIIVAIPDLEGPAPRWIYFSFSICLFAYQTLDNVDGRQARRTNTSSPLGELFDHGIDSLNCVLGGLVQCASLAIGHSPYAILLVLTACWPMYLSTWEEYHTGILYLGPINGPTEGILIACTIHLISAIKGPDFWSEPVHRAMPSWISWTASDEALMVDMFMLLVGLALVFGHAPACLLNVKKALDAKKRAKGSSTTLGDYVDAVVQLAPMFAFTGLSLTWVLSPYSCLLDRQKLIEFSFMLCFIFGRISTKMILAHLTKGSFPWYSSMYIPLALGALLVNLPVAGFPQIMAPWLECLYLHAAVFLSFLAYSHASLNIIDTFCAVLGINCLTIPHHQRSFGADSRRH